MTIFNNNAAQVLLIAFFIITYVVSVIEKLADWKGTIQYYTSHFNKTIFQKIIPLLLAIVVILEIITFVLLAVGLFFLLKNNTSEIANLGLELSAITLLCFLFGQRIAKDYPGAMNITVYFILNIIGIYILT